MQANRVLWVVVVRTLSPVLALVAVVGCSAPSASAPGGTEAVGLLSQMRRAYAAAYAYEDRGVAFVPSNDGRRNAYRFSTRFFRSELLEFEVQTPERWLVVSDSARTIERQPTGLEVAHPGPERALAAISGISGLSSSVVPSLLSGRDFCDCLVPSNARALETVAEDGVVMRKLEVRKPNGELVMFWVDSDGFVRKLLWSGPDGTQDEPVLIEYVLLSHR